MAGMSQQGCTVPVSIVLVGGLLLALDFVSQTFSTQSQKPTLYDIRPYPLQTICEGGCQACCQGFCTCDIGNHVLGCSGPKLRGHCQPCPQRFGGNLGFHNGCYPVPPPPSPPPQHLQCSLSSKESHMLVTRLLVHGLCPWELM